MTSKNLPEDRPKVRFSTTRIHTPVTASANYVSEFDLVPNGSSIHETFRKASYLLLGWAEGLQRLPEFEIREERHGSDEAAPELWAVHIRHREKSLQYRRFWHTDVVFRRDGDSFAIRVAVSHSLDFGYVGWPPPSPEPSAPNFICDWLGSHVFSIRSGQFPIAAVAKATPGTQQTIKQRIGALAAHPARADDLARLIFDPKRSLPVLLINGEVNPVTFPVHPHDFQQRLLGTCYVVWAKPVSGWSSAWNKYFPKGFHCPIDAVRLYQPNASREATGDSLRHRYFSDEEIRTKGKAEAFIAMVRDGLTRRLLAPKPGRIASCEDVLTVRERDAFNQQKARLSSKSDELALYETEYDRLLKSKSEADQLLQETDCELKRLRTEYDALRPYAESLAKELKTAKDAATPLINHRDLFLRFAMHDTTVVDQLFAIQALHPESVHILPSSISSAKAAERFGQPELLGRMLHNLATDFRQCLIDGKGTAEGLRIFGRKNYASGESDNLSSKGRSARTFVYKGASIFMDQHLKIGVKDSEANCLRVHFFWDSTAAKIVIGHCGKHLPL